MLGAPGTPSPPQTSPLPFLPGDAPDPETVVQGLEDLRRGPEFLLLVIAMGEPAVEALARFLGGPPSPHPQPRMLAVEALGAIGGATATRTLEAVVRRTPDLRSLSLPLTLSEEAVRDSAARQLAHLGDPASVEPLLETLGRSHLIGAGEALVAFRETRAIPLLVGCLGDGFTRERTTAVLIEFGRKAVPPLIAGLRTIELDQGAETPRSVERRAACARLLGEIKDPAAEPPLRDSLGDPAPAVRRSAAVALARIAPEASVPKRVRVLIDGLADPMLSDECAEALLASPGEALPALVSAVSAEAAAASEHGVRVPSRAIPAMLRVVARLGDPGTRVLADLAHHQHALVRGLAIAHLGRTRAPIAPSVIIAALRDADARVRRTATASARRLGLDTRASDVAGLAHTFTRAWRVRLARLLGRLGDG